MSLFGYALAPILLLTQGAAPVNDFSAVTCGGTYPHHLQGVCSDGRDAIYWSFTTKLVKTDRSGKILNQIDVANHHGDLCFYQGKVFVAVNLGEFNNPGGKADSWVYVYDAEDLSLLDQHGTPEAFHGAGGIAVHDGRFLVVGGLPDGVNVNYVYEYDGDYRFVRKHTLESGHTNLGIQTAAFHDGSWWFGCYGRAKTPIVSSLPPILLKADASLKHVERFEFDCSLGIMPIGDGKFLVARGGIGPNKNQTGRLVPAVADEKRGLRLLDQAGNAAR